MKYFELKETAATLLFVAVFICFSCSSANEQRKLVMKEDNKNYSFKIFETKSKTNSDNEMQCAKFVNYQTSPDGFKLFGADFKNMISLLLDIKPHHITIGSNVIDNKFFEIHFNGEMKKPMNQEMLQKLFDFYDLELDVSISEKKVFEFKIDEWRKIKKFKSKSCKNMVVQNINGNIYDFKNTSLKVVASVFEEKYDEVFIFKETNKDRYDFTLNFHNDLDANLSILSETYGVVTKIDKKMMNHYMLLSKN